MARFPDHVVLLDTGVLVPHDSGGRAYPGFIVNCLVSVHDTNQPGGTQTVLVPSGGGARFTVQYPFQVQFDVLLSTDDYFNARAFFHGHRKDPQTIQVRGVGNTPPLAKSPVQQGDELSPPSEPYSIDYQNFYPQLFATGRVPQGVFEYPYRENVLVQPVDLPGYIDPFGTPLDVDRGELGLSIEYSMVRKEITRFVCQRNISVF